jgi:hypothetical protein
MFWLTLVLSSIRGALAYGLLDGTKTALEKSLEIKDKDGKKTTIPNPSYAAWVSGSNGSRVPC